MIFLKVSTQFKKMQEKLSVGTFLEVEKVGRVEKFEICWAVNPVGSYRNE